MRVVTGTAPAEGDRRMNVLLADQGGPVMAEETEFFSGGPQLKPVGRLMGVVALRAEPLLNGRVNGRFPRGPVMALVAEAFHVLDGLEFMLADRLVAEATVAGRGRAMHVFFLAHPVMAAACNTGRIFRRAGGRGKAAAKKKY